MPCDAMMRNDLTYYVGSYIWHVMHVLVMGGMFGVYAYTSYVYLNIYATVAIALPVMWLCIAYTLCELQICHFVALYVLLRTLYCLVQFSILEFFIPIYYRTF